MKTRRMSLSIFTRAIVATLFLSVSIHAMNSHSSIQPAFDTKIALSPTSAQQAKKSKQQLKRDKKRQKRAETKKVIHKTLRDMDFDELKIVKNKALAEKKYDSALVYIERMLKLYDNEHLQEIETILLEYADTHYHCQHFQKAENIYNEFANLYPGSAQTEYAFYQAIACSFKLILDPERDQTKTHETIELADHFLERSDIFTEYKDRVIHIRKQCYANLAASEFDVYESFKKRESSFGWQQAERRLKGIRTTWLDKNPEIESRLLVCECQVAAYKQDTELLAQKQVELASKFPIMSTQLAQEQTVKSKNRF